MQVNIKKGKLDQNTVGDAYRMTKEEKDISFLNNYFIYKKVRNIDVADVTSALLPKTDSEELDKLTKTLEAKIAVEEGATLMEDAIVEANKSPTITNEEKAATFQAATSQAATSQAATSQAATSKDITLKPISEVSIDTIQPEVPLSQPVETKPKPKIKLLTRKSKTSV